MGRFCSGRGISISFFLLNARSQFVDWREVGKRIFAKDDYTYQVNLYKDDKVFEGPVNRFQTVEGSSLLDHAYLPTLQIEPKEELGFFSFSDEAGARYQNLYVAADMSLVLFNRFIARGMGQMSLHSTDPGTSLTFTRIGGGFRFFGHGENTIFGYPHIYRVDVLVNHTGYTTYPGASIRRFTHISLLVEPHFVLWAYHYLVPWIEYGARSRMDHQRVSFGLNYHFFIRPWSVKLGIGVSYDKLFRYDDIPAMRFNIFRAMSTFTFFL